MSTETRPCPGCAKSQNPGTQHLQAFDQKTGYGMLEQSGKTHIKTKTWKCDGCGRTDWDKPPEDATCETTEVREPLTGKVISVPRSA